TALDRTRGWIDREVDDPGLAWLRSAFGAVWLVYDVCDLLSAGTATVAWWAAGGIGAPRSLQALQLGLVACEAAMVVGSGALVAPLAAAALRGVEAYWFLPLNDFYCYVVFALLLSQVPRGAPWSGRRAARGPAWMRDALRWQAA